MTSLAAANPGHVRVVALPVTDVLLARALTQTTWLDGPSVKRLAELKHDTAREAHVLSRVFMRAWISRELGVNWDEFELDRRVSGELWVEGAAPSLHDIRISLSHTDGLIVFGIMRGGRIGVDAERRDRRISAALIERALSASELDIYHQAEPATRDLSFLAHWTLKEALAKALGVGVALGFRDVTFDVGTRGDAHARLIAAPPIAEPLGAWRCTLLQTVPEYVTALAVQCDALDEPPIITVDVVAIELDPTGTRAPRLLHT